jgi:hypothetical protein
MPLAAGHPTLKTDIEDAYITARDDGSEDDADSDAIIAQLAEDIGNAVHTYMETALVSTTVIVEPASSNASGSPAATAVPIASYITPGSGTGTGTISFEGGDVDTLISDIEAAFITVRDDGAEDEADPDAIIATLATDLKTAIDTFALTALVETDVTVFPGQTVFGYMAIAGPATVPVPAVSLAGTGSGEGDPGNSEGLS